MSAKEMFEKLGYKLISGDNKELINYRIDLDDNNFIQVVFNNEYKTFWYGATRNTYFDGYLRKENSFIPTNMKLLQAINKQVEELGWLGDKEIEEIPQFKGTLEQLDNLTILGDKE